MSKAKQQKTLKGKRKTKQESHVKLDTLHLEAMTRDSLGRTDIVILFDPFGNRIDHIISDVCEFLEAKGCKITSREAQGNNWAPDHIKFTVDTEKDKIFTCFFHPLVESSLPKCSSMTLGLVTCSVMKGDNLKSALDLAESNGCKLNILNHEIY